MPIFIVDADRAVLDEAPPLPTEIVGTSRVEDTVGVQPMLLQVGSMRQLLGRDVSIGSKFRLWDIFEGAVTSFGKQTMPSRGMLTYPTGALPREIALGNHTPDLYQIVTADCHSQGKALDGCPTFVIGHDLDTRQLGLVTFPFGFAVFGRVPNAVAADGAKTNE